MKLALVLGAVTLLTISAHAHEIVDLLKVAGKTSRDVAAYLGEPSHCEPIKCGQKCHYDKGETEIVFIDGKADWITVEAMDQTPFSPAALGALGLDVRKPTFVNPKCVYRWNTFPGILDISIFRGRVNADYAYIQVNSYAASKQCPVPVTERTQASVAPSDDQAMPEKVSQIQLGAYGSAQMAHDAWGRIKSTAPAEIRNLPPIIIKVNHGGRDLYRLRVGPVVNPKAACDDLRAIQQACIVVPN